MRWVSLVVLSLLLCTAALAHTVEEGATPEHEAAHEEVIIPPWAELAAGIAAFVALAWFLKAYW